MIELHVAMADNEVDGEAGEKRTESHNVYVSKTS